MSGQQDGSRGRGRPRDPAIDAAIIDAYGRLLGARGREGLTREHVAAEAGVSVMAVYRRYASLEDLQVAAAGRPVGGHLTTPDTGSVRRDLREYLGRLAAAMSTDVTTPRVIAEELAVLAGSDRVRAAFSAFVSQRHAELTQILSRAVDRGELAAGTDVEILVDVLRGALYYRLLVRHAPVNDEFVDRLLAATLEPLNAAPRSRSRRTSRR